MQRDARPACGCLCENRNYPHFLATSPSAVSGRGATGRDALKRAPTLLRHARRCEFA